MIEFVWRLVRNPRKTTVMGILFNLALALVVIGGFMTFVLGAEDPAAGEAAAAADAGMKYLGAGLAVAGSTIGAGVALYGATSAGSAALVERPELAVWVLILAGLGEGVAIYGLIIAILILGG